MMSDRLPNSDGFHRRSHIYRSHGNLQTTGELHKEIRGEFWDVPESEPLDHSGRTECDCAFDDFSNLVGADFFCDRRYHYYEPISRHCSDVFPSILREGGNQERGYFSHATGGRSRQTMLGARGIDAHDGTECTGSALSDQSYDYYYSDDDYNSRMLFDDSEYMHMPKRRVTAEDLSAHVDGPRSHRSLSSHRRYDVQRAAGIAYPRNNGESDLGNGVGYRSGRRSRASADYRRRHDDGFPAYRSAHRPLGSHSLPDTERLLLGHSTYHRAEYLEPMDYSPETRSTTSHASQHDFAAVGGQLAEWMDNLQHPSSYTSHEPWPWLAPRDGERGTRVFTNKQMRHMKNTMAYRLRHGAMHASRQGPARSYKSEESPPANGTGGTYRSPDSKYSLGLYHTKSEGGTSIRDELSLQAGPRMIFTNRPTRRTSDMDIDTAADTPRVAHRIPQGGSIHLDEASHTGLDEHPSSPLTPPLNPYTRSSAGDDAQQRAQAAALMGHELKIATEGQQSVLAVSIIAPAGSRQVKVEVSDQGDEKSVEKTCGGGGGGSPTQAPAKSKLIVTGPGPTARKTNPGKYCEHDTWRSRCKTCKLPPICEHGLKRPTCKECGGSYCVHKRRWSHCRECGGSCICPHNRRKTECRDCGGSAVCTHKKLRVQCKICRWTSNCRHRTIRSQCHECNPNAPNLPPGLQTLQEGQPSEESSHE